MAILISTANPCIAPVIPSAKCTLADGWLDCPNVQTSDKNHQCGLKSFDCQAASYASAKDFKNSSVYGKLNFIGVNNRHGCRSFSSVVRSGILVVWRGVCPFAVKAKVAQDAGFQAIIIVDGTSNTRKNGEVSTLQAPVIDDLKVRIPCVMVHSQGIFNKSLETEIAVIDEDIRIDLSLTISRLDLSMAFVAASNMLQHTSASGRDDALVCADAAIRADPENPDSHYHRANLLHKLLRWNEAFASYSKTLSLDPEHLPGHTNLPTLLYKYDIDGLPLAAKEKMFQHSRRKAQELVVEAMQAEILVQASSDCGTQRSQWRLIREWEAESSCTSHILFKETSGEQYGQLALGTGSQPVPSNFPLNPSGLEEFNNLFYFEKRTTVTFFSNVSLAGYPGVICDACGRIFVPSPRIMVPLHSLLDSPGLPRKDSPHYVSRAITAVQMSCDNYYHWTVECLPRLIVSLEHLSNTSRLAEGWTVLLPMISKSFILETLDIIGLPRNMHTIQHDPDVPLLIGELLAVDWTPAHGVIDGRPGCEMTPARTALDRVRWTLASPFLPILKVGENYSLEQSRNTVVFISRNTDSLSGKQSRVILNEGAVIEAFVKVCNERNAGHPGASKLHFEIFRGDNYNQRDTISLFRRARVIIGIHGAGLANAVYCAPGTALLEIALATPRHRDYMHLAMSLGHTYWLVDIIANSLESAVSLDVTQVAAVLIKALDAQEQI